MPRALNSDEEYYASQNRARDLLHLITKTADDLANSAEHYREASLDGSIETCITASHAAALLGLLQRVEHKVDALRAELRET